MDYSENNIKLILTAAKFAAEKHRDQRRKNKKASPYINHPVEVAELLWNLGNVRDIQVIAAALLHDTLEDTDTTPEEITSLFGSQVASLVQEVTDDKRRPKPERKQLQIEHAPHLSDGARHIKLADKISNLREMISDPPAKWSLTEQKEYISWAIKVAEGLRGINHELETYFDQIVHTLSKKT